MKEYKNLALVIMGGALLGILMIILPIIVVYQLVKIIW